MLEYFTRMTTSPAVSASWTICSKPAATFPSRSWIRNALNAFMSGPVQPVLDALAVELDVVVEQPVPLAIVPRKAVRVEPARHHGKHAAPKLVRAVRRVAAARAEVRVGEHALLHLARETLEIGDLRVVRQEDRARTVRHEPVHGPAESLGVEVHGRRRREDEGAALDVEVAVGDAEGVAGEDHLVCAVHDAVVVQRVPRRVDHLQLAGPEPDPGAVADDEDAGLVDRHDLAVEVAEPL